MAKVSDSRGSSYKEINQGSRSDTELDIVAVATKSG